MSKYTYLLIAGHGGMVDGNYVTPGKRFDHRPEGPMIYEGVWNRKVRDNIATMMEEHGLEFRIVNPEDQDIDLNERVKRVNAYQEILGNCVLFEIHANAGGGKGFEVYTSEGTTQSDAIADVWIDEMVKLFPDNTNRGEKDRNFLVIRKTTCPAILTESFFMDTLNDAKEMDTPEGRYMVALAHLNTALRLEGLREG